METGLVAIIAYPKFLRDGLRILLQTLPSVGVIRLADNAGQLLTLPMPAAPAVLVWDWADSTDDGRRWLAQIRARWPTIRTLALVDDEEQGELVLIAGVDVVLTKGTPAAKILTAVNDLLEKPASASCNHPECLVGGNCLDDHGPRPLFCEINSARLARPVGTFAFRTRDHHVSL